MKNIPRGKLLIKDMAIEGQSVDPPVIIISDGKIIKQGLEDAGLSKSNGSQTCLTESILRKKIFFFLPLIVTVNIL